MKLQVLLYQKELRWTAVGLEHCVFGGGASIEIALQAFLRDLSLQIVLDQGAGLEPLSETPPADEEFWERYRQSQLHLTFDIPVPAPAQDWVQDIRVAA
jgi:hypothetical protein